MKEIVDEFEDIGFLYEAWPHMESLEVETGLIVLADGHGEMLAVVETAVAMFGVTLLYKVDHVVVDLGESALVGFALQGEFVVVEIGSQIDTHLKILFHCFLLFLRVRVREGSPGRRLPPERKWDLCCFELKVFFFVFVGVVCGRSLWQKQSRLPIACGATRMTMNCP